ncbi:selenium metabolism-associated LysR family transcriptional regulator [uncultured Eubacterium sp.]|uniref:selenium metabolism-associated LysR family transcriptional regulator n=1 Tax=uncultured Eubacterium sp. TaxID=165185 RepID=UPI0015AAD0D9|nr:selenium metabolism-associated LysR family transcriptional regulator [uncultured Eubacterium sp.]
MDIRQLEAFVYTVKYQSFSQAAQKLYLSQPTVSAHIRSLEQEFHIQLLKRTTKTLSVTPAGMKLYQYASEILTLQQKAVLELSNEGTNKLQIGVSSVPSLYVLPELLATYHDKFSDVTFHTICGDSLEIIHKIDDGTCDLGLVGTTCSDTTCEFLAFASDELVIATPATPYYQDFTKKKEPLNALLKEPFLLREDNSGTKQETLHFLKNRGLTLDDLNVIAIMDDAGSLKKCIKLGMGISILSRATVAADAKQGKLLFFPLGKEAFLRKLYIVYSPVRYLSEPAGHFLEFLKNYYQLS